MHPHWTPFALLVLVSASAACDPRPPPGCPSASGTDAGAATRVYTLTMGTEGTFPTITPWRDGDVVPLEHGFQGGYMLRPTLDIETGDYPDTNCFHVYVDNVVADGTPVTQYDAYVSPEPDTRPHVFRVELFDLLSMSPSDVDGKVITMHVRIAGANGNGETTVTVTARSSTP